MNRYKYLFLSLVAVSLIACDDVVDIDLNSSEPVLVVDAWLNNESQAQEIKLTLTRPYFDNSAAPVIDNATVTVLNKNKGVSLNFQFSNFTQSYLWTPGLGETIGDIGDNFELEIIHQGVTYTSSTELFPAPAVDSITFEYYKKDIFTEQDYYFGEFWARDLKGEGNSYWIKTWKNDVYLNKPSEINLAYDAAFTGASFDSAIFIQPIRNLMNPFEEIEGNKTAPPYLPEQKHKIVNGEVLNVTDRKGKLRSKGFITNDAIYFDLAKNPDNKDFELLDGNPFFIRNDSLIRSADVARVEIHSISNEALFFMIRVAEETNVDGGFAALFATPLANVTTNIEASDEGVRVVGFFNVASITSLTQEINSASIRDEDPD